MCAASVGRKPVAERMIVMRPVSTSNGPNMRPCSPARVVSTTNPPVKLSSVPNRSAVIWWHSEQETPSAASESSGVSGWLTGRWSKMRPCPPRCRSSSLDIGMWQREHSSWISSEDSGWSITSRRTPACQYGSRDELAMMDARHSTPIEMSSPAGVTSWLWHAMHWSPVRNTGGSARPAASSAKRAARGAAVSSSSAAKAPTTRETCVRIVVTTPRRSRRRTSPRAGRSTARSGACASGSPARGRRCWP